LKTYYSQLAADLHCDFFCAADYAKPCMEDAVHLDVTGHKNLAKAFYQKIIEMGI